MSAARKKHTHIILDCFSERKGHKKFFWMGLPNSGVSAGGMEWMNSEAGPPGSDHLS
jgi:hypothetical protein